jgi:glycerol-3-phosphate cytidylyltransferase
MPDNPRVGFIAGAFDLLHPGHILALGAARSQCDVLVVGLHVDPSIERPTCKSKPVQSVLERYIQLKGCRYVSEIVPYETEADLLNILNSYGIDVRFLDENYAKCNYTGSTEEEHSYSTRYIPRNHTWSSSELRGQCIRANVAEVKKIFEKEWPQDESNR